MRSKTRSLFFVIVFMLPSGCYLSYEKEPSRDVDEDVGANHDTHADIGDVPLDGGIDSWDTRTDRTSIIGTWRGSASMPLFRQTVAPTNSDSGWIFEFTETEVIVFVSEIETFRASYSIDTERIPHQLNLQVNKCMYSRERAVLECLPGPFTMQAIFKREGDALIIATTMPGSSSRPHSFIPAADGSVKVFDLTSAQ